MNEKEEEISKLKDDLEKLTQIVLSMKKSLDNLENNETSKQGNCPKCIECGKHFKSTKGIKIHMKSHEKISQLDGNDSFSLDGDNSETNTFEIRFNIHERCDVDDIAECLLTNLNGTLKEMEYDLPEDELKITKVRETRIDRSRALMVLHVEVRNDPSIEATLLKFDPINYMECTNWDDLCFNN